MAGRISGLSRQREDRFQTRLAQSVNTADVAGESHGVAALALTAGSADSIWLQLHRHTERDLNL